MNRVYFTDGSPVQIAAHIARMRDWIACHPRDCPAQAGLIYNWNEFDEGGGSLCPTFIAGSASGDKSRLDAIALTTRPA